MTKKAYTKDEVFVTWKLEICTSFGIPRAKRRAYSGLGASVNKPYCDETHKQINIPS